MTVRVAPGPTLGQPPPPATASVDPASRALRLCQWRRASEMDLALASDARRSEWELLCLRVGALDRARDKLVAVAMSRRT